MSILSIIRDPFKRGVYIEGSLDLDLWNGKYWISKYFRHKNNKKLKK